MRVLVTGGAGFVGHHLVEHLLKTTDHEVVVLDRLDASGNLNRLGEMVAWQQNRRRTKFIHHDLRAEISPLLSSQIGKIEVVFHLAAGSHVDRSIEDPLSFVLDNVVGTTNLLNWARQHDSLHRLMQFSTDEVFGPAPSGVAYQEWDRHAPKNPYAASKAAADDMCIAFYNTYGLPVAITQCMNIIGERQHPEKFVPLCIKRIRDGETVYIHSDETLTVPGSRFYIHARNVAAAVLFVFEKGLPGQKYNIQGEREISNLEMAQLIAQYVGRPLRYEMLSFHASRPGHDLRYALNGDLMAEMGWRIPVGLEESLRKTVEWTLEHPHWLAC